MHLVHLVEQSEVSCLLQWRFQANMTITSLKRWIAKLQVLAIDVLVWEFIWNSSYHSNNFYREHCLYYVRVAINNNLLSSPKCYCRIKTFSVVCVIPTMNVSFFGEGFDDSIGQKKVISMIKGASKAFLYHDNLPTRSGGDIWMMCTAQSQQSLQQPTL